MRNFWQISNWQEADKHLRALSEAPFRRPFPKIKIERGLYLIRGPRQVGKSSWLKTILSILPADKTFFLSCENLRDHLDLAEVFKANRSCHFFLLDEVSFVKEWWRAIKHELDSSTHKAIVLSGSHAADLKSGADLMPGRFDRGGEFELLPMNFNEFCEMRVQAKWPKLSRLEALELYFRVGGFPHAVIEAGPNGADPVKARDIYRRWLLGDLLKLGKQEAYLQETMGQIALTMTSGLSLQKLAQKTQMGSHMTAQSYIETLEACFALKTLYSIDAEKNRFQMKKEKKFYFRDPLIYWLALEWAGLDQPANAYEVVAEMVAHEHLLRRYKRFGVYSNRSGEIDFVSPKKWALEVKWSGHSGSALSNAYKNLRLPFKAVWSPHNFLDEWPD